MTIKMIAVDMDGTFLNSEKKYNVARFNALFSRLKEKDIQFVVASGNQYFQLRSFFPDTYQDITFVAENGANIVMGDTPFYNAELDDDTIQQTLTIVEELEPTNLIVCGKNSAYISEQISDEAYKNAKFYYHRLKKISNLHDVTKENDAIFKFALSYTMDNAAEKLASLQHSLGNILVPVSSGHEDIDLIIPGVHKYNGLKLLGEEWGIKDDEIATFGDSGNDLEMLQHTTHSYAMQNAQENVKNAANTIIGSNDSEAVLDTIESFILD
ncbi:HAD family hydrolase [Listeria booriae]|uniref:HAD family hydrolase n=1 Tax=Listeria booriae TaxID=1552123 RepID=A0A7X0Z0G7_9LIST|nr:Cof-type HAD-IIB family hydrolase [Listeria booriae]MBC2166457.1 HAD family hydrolase [Listeria booriae]